MPATTFSEIRDALTSAASGFDASRLPMSSAADLLTTITTIERTAAALKATLAARVAASDSWRDAGARSAAHHLAQQTGTSLGQAQAIVETGRRLDQLPAVADAARAGHLSPQQTQAIASAASANPSAAPALLDLAPRRSLAELQEECAKVRATADDLEERRRRIHAQRSLRTYTDHDGVAHFHLRSNPEVVAELTTALTPIRDRLFKAARTAGRREHPDALTHDALLTFVREAATPADAAAPTQRRAQAQAKVLVRVDFDTLLRGTPIDGETCELVGYGPVAVSTVTDLIDAGAVLHAIATRGQQVQGVAHLGRKPTAAQQTALEWINPSCAAEGCPHTARLERDHRTPWADTKITLLDLMDRLCAHHHRLKTHQNWALVNGHGKRAFVPPADLRHPDRPESRAGPPA
jgi:hypothetical protein